MTMIVTQIAEWQEYLELTWQLMKTDTAGGNEDICFDPEFMTWWSNFVWQC